MKKQWEQPTLEMLKVNQTFFSTSDNPTTDQQYPAHTNVSDMRRDS